MLTKDISLAAQHLKKGDIVAIPTETVYGLASNIYNETAIKNIFKVKGRPLFNPLIVHIHSLAQLDDIVSEFPPIAKRLAKHFWPGPLTLILPKKEVIPEIITAGKPTVAVRMPKHPMTRALLQLLPFPIAAPSANPFNRISPTSAEHVKEYFDDQVPLILNGGACQKGIESTIVGVEDAQVTIYRLGTITKEEIEAIVGNVILKNMVKGAPNAPGMLAKHYAPLTKTILVDDVEEYMLKNLDLKLAVLSFSESFTNENVIATEQLSGSQNLEEASFNLYAALHRLDAKKADLMIVERLPEEGIGKSINDRLERASQSS